MCTNIVCSNFGTLSLQQGPYSFVEATIEGDKHRESNVDEQRHDHDCYPPSDAKLPADWEVRADHIRESSY